MSHSVWLAGHWDAVITLYREIQKSRWGTEAQAILNKVYKHPVFPPETQFFPYVHVLDLHGDGVINVWDSKSKAHRFRATKMQLMAHVTHPKIRQIWSKTLDGS